MKILRPIFDKKIYSQRILKAVGLFLCQLLFVDIMAVVDPIEEYYNAADPLAEAIRANRIQCIHGVPISKFYGKFDAKTSKRLVELGAKWNNRTKTFDILRDAIPMNILDAIGFATLYQTAIRKSMIEILKNVDVERSMPQLNELLKVPLDEIMEDLSAQAKQTLQAAMTVEVKLSAFEKEQLTANYTKNIGLSIKTFAEKEVVKLRQMIEQNTFEGLNNTTLVEALQKEFNLTYNKARFLARNETMLLVSNYRMAQYKEMGIKQYKWSTSGDERVRDSHNQVNGRIFNWDTPPVETNGKHPGQDYLCRCIARPIIE